MNERIQNTVRSVLAERGISQGELARRTGIAAPTISRMLNGDIGKVPDSWKQILDELGYEVTITPKRTEHE